MAEGEHRAIQIDAISFIDEGVEAVLDFLRDEVGLNVLWVSTHSFAFGTIGRSLQGFIPDHGKQVETIFDGGSLVTNHPQYYEGVNLKQFAARDEEIAGYDVLAAVMEPAKRRGFQVFSRLAENSMNSPMPRVIAGFPRVMAIDCLGRRVNSPCYHDPQYRDWYLAVVEDHVKSYPIDGVAFGAEGAGPLQHLFENGTAPRSFSRHALAAGRERGIDAERAREGMTRLWRFVTGTKEIPREGYFVELLRILFAYPEILAWEKLYMDARESMRKEIYGVVKAINNRVQVGWHLWHTIVYDPILRAETNYADYADYSDYLKPAIYHACAAERMRRRCIEPHQKRLLRDVSPELVSQLYHSILGLDGPGYDKMNETRLGGAYVAAEIERIRAATADRVPVYPGIDVDIPSGDPELRSEPEDLTEVLQASYAAGAKGFVLSRKYSEMRLKNLRAVGKLLRARGA